MTAYRAGTEDDYLHRNRPSVPVVAMQHVRSARPGQAVLAALLVLALSYRPAAALDLLAQHQVTVHFATEAGKPMADAAVRVFAPGGAEQRSLEGRTDQAGKFEFAAERDGFWSAEARTGGEIARVMIRVGEPAQQNDRPPSPYWLIGALCLLLVLAFTFRALRARSRRPRG